jgi:hypothetical protein
MSFYVDSMDTLMQESIATEQHDPYDLPYEALLQQGSSHNHAELDSISSETDLSSDSNISNSSIEELYDLPNRTTGDKYLKGKKIVNILSMSSENNFKTYTKNNNIDSEEVYQKISAKNTSTGNKDSTSELYINGSNTGSEDAYTSELKIHSEDSKSAEVNGTSDIKLHSESSHNFINSPKNVNTNYFYDMSNDDFSDTSNDTRISTIEQFSNFKTEETGTTPNKKNRTGSRKLEDELNEDYANITMY